MNIKDLTELLNADGVKVSTNEVEEALITLGFSTESVEDNYETILQSLGGDVEVKALPGNAPVADAGSNLVEANPAPVVIKPEEKQLPVTNDKQPEDGELDDVAIAKKTLNTIQRSAKTESTLLQQETKAIANVTGYASGQQRAIEYLISEQQGFRDTILAHRNGQFEGFEEQMTDIEKSQRRLNAETEERIALIEASEAEGKSRVSSIQGRIRRIA